MAAKIKIHKIKDFIRLTEDSPRREELISIVPGSSLEKLQVLPHFMRITIF